MLYITSDHGGFNLKLALLQYLNKLETPYMDLGPYGYVNDDDYPDYVDILVQKMRDDTKAMGVVICRNGAGVTIYANKFKGIRAILSWDPKHAASTRNDDDTNVLALPADFINSKKAEEILTSWLEAPFSQEKRHYRRLDKVNSIGA